MLSSMMSSTMSSTTSSMTSSTITMLSTVGLAEISVASVICLIVLLSASEILSASKLWNERLSLSFSLAILPLIVAFCAVVLYKVAEIL